MLWSEKVVLCACLGIFHENAAPYLWNGPTVKTLVQRVPETLGSLILCQEKTIKSFWISWFHTVLMFCSVSENYNHLNWFLNGHWTFCGLKLTFQESKMLQSDRCLNCVTKFLNLFKKLTTALWKIWILQDLNCASFELCKIWIVQDLDCARFGSQKLWIAEY